MTHAPKLTATRVRRLEAALEAALRGDTEAARAIYDGAQPKAPTTRAKRNMTLAADTQAMLDATGNASRYVDSIVAQRWRAWQSALDVLRRSGWRAAEVRAACAVLLGPPLPETPPKWIAAEMVDGEQLNGTATEHGVEKRVWAARCRQVAEVDEVARALAVVIAEFWSDNDALERSIARLDEG